MYDENGERYEPWELKELTTMDETYEYTETNKWYELKEDLKLIVGYDINGEEWFDCWYCEKPHRLKYMIPHHLHYRDIYDIDTVEPVGYYCHKKIHNKD